MSEVVAVAAIAGIASVLASITKGLVTWLVANREAKRRNRQETYLRFNNGFNPLYNALGCGSYDERTAKLCDDYVDLVSAVVLFGTRAVRRAALELNDVYEKIWPTLKAQESEFPGKSDTEHWCEVTKLIKLELKGVADRLVSQMQADIDRGLTWRPAPARSQH